MQSLEVSGAVRLLQWSLCVKGLSKSGLKSLACGLVSLGASPLSYILPRMLKNLIDLKITTVRILISEYFCKRCPHFSTVLLISHNP